MSWVRFCITIAAWYQRAKEAWVSKMRALRSRLFYRILHLYDPRTMFLLQNGQWVDKGAGFRTEQIAWIYDAPYHMLYRSGEAVVGRGIRWSWLGVVEAGGEQRDLTDFFTELRISQAPTPSVSAMLGLFAHQKGWMPRGQLQITRRDGEEMLIESTTGAVIDTSEPPSGGGVSVAHLNFIH